VVSLFVPHFTLAESREWTEACEVAGSKSTDPRVALSDDSEEDTCFAEHGDTSGSEDDA
jgi:hypothetical protein